MIEPEKYLPMNRAELIARCEALEKEQWLVAECIFQNVSAGEMKHWAQGIKVSLSGADKVPRFTVETPVQQTVGYSGKVEYSKAAHASVTETYQVVQSPSDRTGEPQ